MIYDQYSEGGGIEIRFEEHEEVTTVRTAFEEHALQLMALGNDSSISDYQREVIRRWQGAPQRYRARNHNQLTERLGYFVEATEERVAVLLDEHDNPDRLVDAARRYELGAQASRLLASIDLQSGMDEAWSELMGDDEPPMSMH